MSAFVRRPRDQKVRAIRPSCPSCGGPLRWSSLSDLVWQLPLDERLSGVEFMLVAGEDADAYACSCGNWGAFADGPPTGIHF